MPAILSSVFGMLTPPEDTGQMEFASPFHRPMADLDAGIKALPVAPRDRGTLCLIVRRRPSGQRETPHRSRVEIEDGLPGDNWAGRTPRNPDTQLTVMRRDLAEMIASGQSLTTYGDNLFVDLDLTAANLPTGTRLKVGTAEVSVTPFPHNGCTKFKARFGSDALQFVNASATRPENRRGIYWKVVVPGEIWVGATVEVLSR